MASGQYGAPMIVRADYTDYSAYRSSTIDRPRNVIVCCSSDVHRLHHCRPAASISQHPCCVTPSGRATGGSGGSMTSRGLPTSRTHYLSQVGAREAPRRADFAHSPPIITAVAQDHGARPQSRRPIYGDIDVVILLQPCL